MKSAHGRARRREVRKALVRTVNAWTLEDLASFTGRTQAVTLDLCDRRHLLDPNNLNILSAVLVGHDGFGPRDREPTLRFLHDLQFIDSRGSLLMRRVGRRSMPTCGRDMVTG